MDGEVGCGYVRSSIAQLSAYRLKSDRPVVLQVPRGCSLYHQSKQMNPSPLLAIKDHNALLAVEE